MYGLYVHRLISLLCSEAPGLLWRSFDEKDPTLTIHRIGRTKPT